MPLTGYAQRDDGLLEFRRDDGTTFALPSTPETVAEAMRLDGGARPFGDYASLVRPTSMAGSPEALADASAVGGGPAAGTSAAPVHSAPVGPSGAGLAAARSQALDFGAPAAAGPPAPGGASDAAWAGQAQQANAEAEARAAATLAEVNAGRAQRGQAPLVRGEGGAVAEAPPPPAGAGAPAQIDPSARLTLPSAGGPRGGSPGDEFRLSPSLQAEIARSNAPPVLVGRTPSGYVSTGKQVRGEQGPSAQTFDDLARANEHVVGLKGALAREEGKALEGKVSAQDQAIARYERERERYQRVYDEEDARIAKTLEDVEKGADPGRFWKNQGAWGQLVGALSILAGQVGAAMMGSNRNLALEIITKRVDEDIASQDPRRRLEASEMRLGHAAKRLGSLQSAIDYERLQRHALVDAQLAKMEADAQGDDEATGQIGLLRAQNSQKIAELAMQIDANKRGVVSESFAYKQGGPVYAGGTPLTFSQRAELRKEAREERELYDKGRRSEAQNARDLRESGAQIAVYNGEQVALRVDKTEAEKVRKTLGAIKQMNELIDERDRLNTMGTRLSPEESARFEQINRSIAAHQSTIDDMGVLGETERKEMRAATQSYLGGKGTSDAMRKNIDARARALLEQTAEGVVRDGRVVPLMGRR